RSRLIAIERRMIASALPPQVARPQPPPLPAASEPPAGVTVLAAKPAPQPQPAVLATATPAVAPAPSEPPAPRPEALVQPAAMTATAPSEPPPWRRALAQNWTGVLGAVITVAGVGFFGVYASFKLGPVGRFALIDGFAALLFLGSRWLLRSETWRPFGT